MIRLLSIFALAICAGCSAADSPKSADERPNILLIVVDDMGFNEIGSFGGEIDTPNLDELALNGVRFADFRVAATCSPTRSMLLTGVDSHLNGLGNMMEELSPNQKGQPGYEGVLNDNVITFATMLRNAGYRTMMSGKWHLGFDAETVPYAKGFDRSFTLLQGGASHFSDMKPAYAPTPGIKANYWEDNQKLTALPSEFEYSSQYYVDRLIEYLDEDRDDAPFFAYLSFTAPHWPLQAPADAIEKYRGRYDEGYDIVADRRVAKGIELGVLPDNAVLGPTPPKYRPWDELDDDQRRVDARAMEVYAAMIDEVDRHSGRLFDHLRASGDFDNTVILFMSDNGAEGHDLDETWDPVLFPDIRNTIDTTHDFSFDNMGHPNSYVLYGTGWGRAGSPAFNLYKAFPTEGGTRVAAFAHHKSFEARVFDQMPVTVMDVAPTILELAGVDRHGGNFENREVHPMTGDSILSMLRGESSGMQAPRFHINELFGKRSVRYKNWKLLHMPPPYGSDDWQLYDLSTDIAEANDIAAEHPEVVAELSAAWVRYANENNVIIPDWVSGY